MQLLLNAMSQHMPLQVQPLESSCLVPVWTTSKMKSLLDVNH